MRDAIILIFANKQDLPEGMCRELSDFSQYILEKSIKIKHNYCFDHSAVTSHETA